MLERLEALERQNRRLRFGLMSVVPTCLVAIGLGQASPQDPTTTSGLCRSNAVCAIRTDSSKSSSGSCGLIAVWPESLR